MNIKSLGFQRYFKNTSWLVADKIVTLVTAVLVGALVARYLGPDSYGLLMYAHSFAAFFLIFSGAGLISILVRNLVKNPQSTFMILGTAFVIKGLASFASLITFYLITLIVPENPFTNYLILIIILVTLFEPFKVIDYYFQSKVLSKYVVKVHFFQTLIAAIIKIALIYFKANLEWFAYAFLIENAIGAVGLVLMYKVTSGSLGLKKFKFDLTYAKSLIKDGWPLLFSGFVIVIYLKVDQIMIKHMLDSASVGHYAVAVKISKVWFFLGTAICASLFPAIINAKKKNQKMYYARLQKLYDFLAILGFAIAIVMTIFSSKIILILFGEAYQPAIGVLIIHIWAVVFVYMGVSSSKWLVAENLQRITLNRTLLGAGVNLVLNFVLIPIMGIKGAALATLISQAVASYFGHAISPHTRSTFKMLTKSLLLYNLVNKVWVRLLK